MKIKTLVCVLVIFVFGISMQYGIAGDFDWPRWRGPNGDGISLETDWNPEALDGDLNVIWKINIGIGCSNVVIRDSYLYTMGYEGIEDIVYCLNAETGKEVWRYSYESCLSAYGTQATPTIDEKYIYTLSTEGMIFCLKLKNGKPRWKKDLSEYNAVKPHYGYAASPVVEGGLIILTSNTSGMVLDKKTGKMIWNSEKPPDKIDALWPKEADGVDYSTPVIYDFGEKRYALLSSWEGMHSVEITTGDVLWVFEWPLYHGSQIPDPLFFNDKVFLAQVCYGHSSIGSLLLDVGGKEPRIIWENMRFSSEMSSPILIDGYIYLSTGGGRGVFGSVACLNVDTGELMWEAGKNNWRPPSITVVDNKLIILDEKGTLRIAEATPTAYQEISSCDVLEGEKKGRNFWTPPVFCNGKIYCRNLFGDLVCIDVSK